MWYIVYNSTTGEILRTGYTSSGSIASQAGTGESVIEGQAASDGSKMIDITETPPAVIDNPDWEEPAAVTPKSNITVLMERIERLENPIPDGDLSVRFSDIVNCGTNNDTHGQQAIFLNNTWTLTKVTTATYLYEDDDVQILVMISVSGGSITAYIKTSPDNLLNFEYAGDVARGGVYANEKTTCASTFDSEGSGGYCSIL